jgi:Neutral/alkaline non-lysosomal ceramidase, N-terminal
MRFHLMLALALAGAGAAACDKSNGLDPQEIPLVVAQRCPGDPACADTGDGKLYAGAAKRDVTPKVEPFTDMNANGVWDPGEPFTDMNGNGTFDAYWIAGYGNGRLATGVNDPNWVRAWVLRYNQTTIAFFSVDVVGLFYDDLLAIRAALPASLDVDLVVSSSTHNHETADPTGQWGPDITTRGVNEAWLASVRAAAVDAITEAVGNLKPATLKAGSIAVISPTGDETQYVSDTRDPVVIENRMHVLEFDDAATGKPITTVVNWAAHPDSIGSHNHKISSDFVHYLRASAELGSGDDVVYVTASVGGQIGSGRVHPIDAAGNALSRSNDEPFDFQFAQAWGEGIAPFVFDALDAAKGGDVVSDAAPKLSFRTTKFMVHVDNIAFQTAGQIGLFSRQFCCYDKKKPLLGDNVPSISTEVAYIRIGDHVSIITIPGELCPELFIGGYDGSAAYNWQFIDQSQPNAPPVAMAPKPPYLRDVMDGDYKHRMVFGLSVDFLGYIVPRYNFVLDPTAPYLAEAQGDHYEETNSLGPRAEPEIVGTARQLVLDGRPNLAH